MRGFDNFPASRLRVTSKMGITSLPAGKEGAIAAAIAHGVDAGMDNDDAVLALVDAIQGSGTISHAPAPKPLTDAVVAAAAGAGTSAFARPAAASSAASSWDGMLPPPHPKRGVPGDPGRRR